eukprot:1458514-Heterocapsa_arctica.AAC.1
MYCPLLFVLKWRRLASRRQRRLARWGAPGQSPGMAGRGSCADLDMAHSSDDGGSEAEAVTEEALGL